MPPPRPIDDRDRHQPCDGAPAAPAVKLGKIVSPHHPDESHAPGALRKKAKRFCGVGCTKLRLKRSHLDARAWHKAACQREPICERRQSTMRFQWVAWRHHPPELVEPQAFQHGTRDEHMCRVRWIERPAHHPYPLARPCKRRLRLHGTEQPAWEWPAQPSALARVAALFLARSPLWQQDCEQ